MQHCSQGNPNLSVSMRGSRSNAKDTRIAAITVLIARIIAFALRTVPSGYWHDRPESADDILQEFISFVALVISIIVDALHQLLSCHGILIVFKVGFVIPFIAYQQWASAAHAETARLAGFQFSISNDDFLCR
jgi:hypothetical protein